MVQAALASAYGAYARSKTVKYAAWILGGLLVLFFLRKKIWAIIEANKPVRNDGFQVGWGKVEDSWIKNDLQYLTITLHKEIKENYVPGTGTNRCAIFQQVLDLNNNQLVALVNDYRTYHKSKLYDDLKALYHDGCGNIVWYDKKIMELLARLTTIKAV